MHSSMVYAFFYVLSFAAFYFCIGYTVIMVVFITFKY